MFLNKSYHQRKTLVVASGRDVVRVGQYNNNLKHCHDKKKQHFNLPHT